MLFLTLVKLPFIQAVEDNLKIQLINWISLQLSNNFNDLNARFKTIDSYVGSTPQAWNSDIFRAITQVSETVLLPLASVVLAYGLLMETYNLLNKQNQMAEVEVLDVIKMLFKFAIAVYVCTNANNIINGIFDVGTKFVAQTASVFGAYTFNDIQFDPAKVNAMLTNLKDPAVELPEVITIGAAILVSGLINWIVTVVVHFYLIARMFEIYLYLSLGTVPFATLLNRDISNIGANYIKVMCAYALQAVLITISFGIFNLLMFRITTVSATADLMRYAMDLSIYVIVFAYIVIRTGNISKSMLLAQ